MFKSISAKYLMLPYQQTFLFLEGNADSAFRGISAKWCLGAFGVTPDPPRARGRGSEALWGSSQDVSTKACIPFLSMCVVVSSDVLLLTGG